MLATLMVYLIVIIVVVSYGYLTKKYRGRSKDE